jgi:hypothetical protein
MSEIKATSRQLLCLIEDESVVFPVNVACSAIVGDLKELIRTKRELDTLKNVGAHTLTLWQVSAIDDSR